MGGKSTTRQRNSTSCCTSSAIPAASPTASSCSTLTGATKHRLSAHGQFAKRNTRRAQSRKQREKPNMAIFPCQAPGTRSLSRDIRRGCLGWLLLVTLLAASPTHADYPVAPDVVVFCEPTLQH